eukprot:CAMPEP_0197035092 /NCGR_PEP_ID=MMETSP1384-20130603/12974_1 /TAXON_ID=29189 /ORGANISM="Ammonia sp." /LENGTH=395 /DNA_ID=CAMNT_0042465103 /DNA_START=41 /DNA_END=1228 /DNA_ORIENTATION=-
MADQKSPELVFVTGASGFIAGHIIAVLLQRGYRVRGTVRSLENAHTKYKYLYDLDHHNLLELTLADLGDNEEKWTQLISDADYVIHTANPMPDRDTYGNRRLPDSAFSDVVVPAMANILNACARNKKLKRFVYTSSTAALGDSQPGNGVLNELTPATWQDLDTPNVGAYAKSKTRAEQQMWRFVKEHANEISWSATSVNPGVVIGPLLSKRKPPSLDVIKMLMLNEMPVLPPHHMSLVDVRDVALIHVHAMECEQSKNKRYVAVSDALWMKDIALILYGYYHEHGYSIPTATAPGWVFKLIGLYEAVIAEVIVPSMHKIRCVDNTQTVRDLGIAFKPIYQSIHDTAESLIEYGFVEKPKPSSVTASMMKIGVAVGAVCGVAYYLHGKRNVMRSKM